MRKLIALLVLCFISGKHASALEAEQLFYALRTKVLTVKDYQADIKMKIDVSYMKIPLLKGKLFFRSPDKMRLEREGGLSLLPRKNINLTLSNLIPTGKVMVLDAGSADIAGKQFRVLKVVPEDDMGGIILSKIWVDEANMLVVRTETTTRNDGTVIMDLTFGKYSAWALPDKVTIHLDLKDYKLPQGVTMDYNNTPKPKDKEKTGGKQKGTISIQYLKYEINKGISDAVFTDKEKA